MDYTKEFKKILEKNANIKLAKIFILKNDNPKKMKVFPQEISDAIINLYLEKLKFVANDKDFVNYIPDQIEKSTLQVLPADGIEVWNKISTARDELPVINMDEIEVCDYNVEGNTILVELVSQNAEKTYFLTRYQKVASWYRNSIRFKKQNGKFKQEDGHILALSPYVDVLISDNLCYIINESNFNKIFKYDEVIKNQVESKKEEICSLEFLGDSELFLNLLNQSKREKQAMAKVLLQKRIEKIKKYKPKYIKEQIQSQKQLSFIEFNKNNTIIINDKSFKVVMDILKGKINIDLITKELNGLEENE